MPFQALYYPSWNPSVQWVRSTLLVFDQIHVIRPAEVHDPQYYSGNTAVYDLLPHTFGEIRKTHYEMTLSPQNKQVLLSTLDLIAHHHQQKEDPRKLVKIKISPDGGKSVPGYTFLHVSKMPPFVNEALNQRHLVNVLAEKLLQQASDFPDFRIVQKDACGVILALIADYYGRAQSLRTVTDDALAYLNVALNENPVRRGAAVQARLASAILRFQIPQQIATLTPKQYVSLRKRYDDLRLPFQHAVSTLCDDNLLAGIESRRQFEEAAHNAAKEFSLGVDKLMKSVFAKKLGKWAPISFGIGSSLCKLGTPVTATLGIGVDCAVKLYNGLASKPPPTDIQNAQKLLATMRREFISPLLMRRIL